LYPKNLRKSAWQNLTTEQLNTVGIVRYWGDLGPDLATRTSITEAVYPEKG